MSLAKALRMRAIPGASMLGTRRIDLETLRRETRAWIGRMNRSRVRINWQFDRKAARRKFHYKSRRS